MTHPSHPSATPTSPRSFGLLFTAVFAALGAYGYLKSVPSHNPWAWWIASVATGAVALAAPHWLAPLSRAWFRLGALMGRVVNPLVFGVMFFGLITPIAFISRRFGRDVLRLKPRTVDSHWIERQPPGPSPESFKNQF